MYGWIANERILSCGGAPLGGTAINKAMLSSFLLSTIFFYQPSLIFSFSLVSLIFVGIVHMRIDKEQKRISCNLIVV